MRVLSKTSKPKGLQTGKKKGVREIPVTLPPVGKKRPDLKQSVMEAQLTAGPNGCEEASPLSQGKYIPCNQPAKHIVFMKADGKSYRMCEGCADHSTRRGGKITGPFVPAKGKQKPLMDDTPIVYGKVHPGQVVQSSKGLMKMEPRGKPSLEEELGVTVASAGELANLSKEVTKAATLTETIEGLEAMLKGHREELHTLTTRTIPDIMRASHTSSHKTDKGVKVELKDFMNGSLPKEPEARKIALGWLEKNGAKDLIKTQIALALGRGQKEDAKKVRAALDKLGMTYTSDEGVHAQSLYAFARERMKAGKELPIETLGLYMGQVAKIELPDKV